MVVIGSYFTSAVIMYFIADFSEYGFLRSNVNVIVRNVFDEMEINSEQTFEKGLKDNFKIVSDNTMRLVLFDQDEKILYSNLENKYAEAINFKHIANKLEHTGEYREKKYISTSNSDPNECYFEIYFCADGCCLLFNNSFDYVYIIYIKSTAKNETGC